MKKEKKDLSPLAIIFLVILGFAALFAFCLLVPGSSEILEAGKGYFIAFVISLLVCSIISGMNSSVEASREAGDYIAKNGVDIQYKFDQYINTTRE